MKCWELLVQPSSWCQNSIALDEDNNEIWPLENKAVRFCAVGAMIRCYPNDCITDLCQKLNYPKYWKFVEELYKHNDTVTYAEIYNMFKEANV